MSIGTSSWEHTLVRLAREGLDSRHLPEVAPDRSPALSRAYQQCEALTRLHSRTFFLASGLLPPPKRRATRALYAFCRISDDLVDRADGDRVVALASWRARVLGAPSAPCGGDGLQSAVALAWADARARYGVPAGYVAQLLDGVARDLEGARYATFGDLAAYCYGVASTVGLMAMHITGFADECAIPYAVKLGVALQLTNILRDVGEDWLANRLYLPLDELAAHGLSEEDVAAGRVDARWQAFMRFQIARNRALYEEALPGIALLHRDGRFAIAAAAELYRGILADVEAHGGDVFARRAHVTRWGKLRELPGIWWRATTGQYARMKKGTLAQSR